MIDQIAYRCLIVAKVAAWTALFLVGFGLILVIYGQVAKGALTFI